MFSSIRKSIAHWYLQYELNTAIYMLEPLEKCGMNTFFFTMFALVTSSAYIYLPHYVRTMLAFFQVIEIDN